MPGLRREHLSHLRGAGIGNLKQFPFAVFVSVFGVAVFYLGAVWRILNTVGAGCLELHAAILAAIHAAAGVFSPLGGVELNIDRLAHFGGTVLIYGTFDDTILSDLGECTWRQEG